MSKFEPDLNTDQIVGHYKKHMGREYIGSHDLMLEDGSYKTANVTIKGTHKREIFNPGKNKTETRVIATFEKGGKQLILNATNLDAVNAIAKTPMIERWGGTRIMLTVESVKVGKKMVDAIRVKPPAQQGAQ